MGVSIVSTINIEKIHLDMNGFYQCVGVHQEIYAQQTFNVHVNTNGKFNNNNNKKANLYFPIDINSIATNFSTDTFITGE